MRRHEHAARRLITFAAVGLLLTACSSAPEVLGTVWSVDSARVETESAEDCFFHPEAGDPEIEAGIWSAGFLAPHETMGMYLWVDEQTELFEEDPPGQNCEQRGREVRCEEELLHDQRGLVITGTSVYTAELHKTEPLTATLTKEESIECEGVQCDWSSCEGVGVRELTLDEGAEPPPWREDG
jgi:hypothetical protein